jgi:hypothetical protein
VTIDRVEDVVLLEDDLDATDAGAIRIPLSDFAAAVGAGATDPE